MVYQHELAEILFAPLSINGLTLNNHLVMGPMASLEVGKNFLSSEQTIAVSLRTARGRRRSDHPGWHGGGDSRTPRVTGHSFAIG